MTEKQPFPAKHGPRWWIWVIIILAVLVLIFLLGVANKKSSSSTSGEFSIGTEPYIATLYVEGTMMTAESMNSTYKHAYLMSTLDELMADPMNEALVLYISSGGGECLAADELSRKVQEYQTETGRPVYAYGYDYAASGAYWLAATADYIMLNPYCISGSIGVSMGQLFDASGFLAEHNVQLRKVVSGAQKQSDDGLTPLTDESVAVYQSIVDEEFQLFLNWVAAGRKMTVEELTPLADGRIYSGLQAAANGLADATGDYGDLLDLVYQEVGDLPVVDYQPATDLDWMSYFLSLATGSQRDAFSSLGITSPVALYDPVSGF